MIKQGGVIKVVTFSESDFKAIEFCPMCGCKESTPFYNVNWEGNDKSQNYCYEKKVSVVKCKSCGLVYSQEILTSDGKEKFWKNFTSNVHEATENKVENRKAMYQIEYDYIHDFLNPMKRNRVLDIGCGEGGFLDLFIDCDCYGVEIGKEAASRAREHYQIYEGELPELDIKERFDLIIFRGSIEYFENPKSYFEKAITLLNRGGKIFITCTPSGDAFVHKLFKNKFTLPVCAVAGIGFTVNVLKTYFAERGLLMCGEKYFYEETPYANIYEDIKTVQKAIEYRKKEKAVDFGAPAFWGNVMSLVFMVQSE